MTKIYTTFEYQLIDTYTKKGSDSVRKLYLNWYRQHKQDQINNLFNSVSSITPLNTISKSNTNLLLFLNMSNNQSLGTIQGNVSTIGVGVGGVINSNGLQAVIPNFNLSSSNVNLNTTNQTQSDLSNIWRKFLSLVHKVNNDIIKVEPIVFFEKKFKKRNPLIGVSSFLSFCAWLVFSFVGSESSKYSDTQQLSAIYLGISGILFVLGVLLALIASTSIPQKNMPIVDKYIIPLLYNIEVTELQTEKNQFNNRIALIRQDILNSLNNTSFDKSTGIIYLEDKYGFHISQLISNPTDLAIFLYKIRWY